MLSDLQWPFLEHRRPFTRLVHQTSVLKLPEYFSNTILPAATTILFTLRFLLSDIITASTVFTREQYVIGTVYPLALLNQNF